MLRWKRRGGRLCPGHRPTRGRQGRAGTAGGLRAGHRAGGLTVQLTPRAEWLQLYVAELGTAQLVVLEAQDKSGLFDYFTCGVRKGYENQEVRVKR